MTLIHHTGSALQDELLSKRDTFREKMYPRAARYWQFDKQATVDKKEAEEAVVELPQFPFLPREVPRFGDLPGPTAIKVIQAVVARHFDITVEDILGIRRPRKITVPRQIAMYLAKVMTQRSIPDIGRRFGDKDHTTVLHAVRMVVERMEAEPEFAREVGKLEEEMVKGE